MIGLCPLCKSEKVYLSTVYDPEKKLQLHCGNCNYAARGDASTLNSIWQNLEGRQLDQYKTEAK